MCIPPGGLHIHNEESSQKELNEDEEQFNEDEWGSDDEWESDHEQETFHKDNESKEEWEYREKHEPDDPERWERETKIIECQGERCRLSYLNGDVHCESCYGEADFTVKRYLLKEKYKPKPEPFNENRHIDIINCHGNRCRIYMDLERFLHCEACDSSEPAYEYNKQIDKRLKKQSATVRVPGKQ
jgi:hypothetical protein